MNAPDWGRNSVVPLYLRTGLNLTSNADLEGLLVVARGDLNSPIHRDLKAGILADFTLGSPPPAPQPLCAKHS